MPLVVVGTIALDSIKTTTGRVDDALGGSATHFSLAASKLAHTRLVGVVGEDFPEEHMELFRRHEIDTEGVTRVDGAKTFRWSGEYHQDMNHRDTLSLELNVFESFDPKLSPTQKQCGFAFLANGHPSIQAKVLDQLEGETFVMADTMDLWIQTTRAELEALIRRIDGLVLNDQEAFLLTDEHNLVAAGRAIREYGLRYVIIKKGEHGCILFHEGGEIALPAMPLEKVIDPTGAGDSFAGGLMGYLASEGKTDITAFKNAAVRGTVLASFCCEDFDVRRMRELGRDEIEERTQSYCEMLDLG